MFKRKPIGPGPVTVHLAESVSEELGQITALIEGVVWEIDSALSSIRKDEAGYRQGNAANPDGGANYVDGELEAAYARGKRLLISLIPTVIHLRNSEHKDIAEAARRIVA